MAKRFLYQAKASFEHEGDPADYPGVYQDYDPVPVRLRRSVYLEPAATLDLDAEEVEGETSAIFFSDCREIPFQLRKLAYLFPYGEFDLHSSTTPEVEGQSFFDCGEMPLLYSRDWICGEHGNNTGHTLWVSEGARYGEMRTIMSRLGNLDTQPARHGTVRVAPVQ